MARARSGEVTRRAPAAQPAAASSTGIATVGLVVILALTLAIVVYVRLRLAGVPLERDEGEYAYAGQLILKGVPPYALAYNMKFPGTYYAYAALMAVFGQTAWGIRVGLLCVHVATIGLVFALGRRLAGTIAGGIGASVFALLALDRWSMGLFAHATHFVLLPALAGLLVLDAAMRSGRARTFMAAGALIGLAIVMKQQALPFAVLAAVLAAWSARGSEAGVGSWWRRGALVAAGIAVAFVALVAVLAAQGVLGRFWFWTFQYASAYVSELPMSSAPSIFLLAWGYITQATAWWWYAGVVGLVLLLVTRWSSSSKRFLLAWFVAAAAAVIPGYFFRPHYFILLMPVIGVLAGFAVVSIEAVLARSMSAVAARATVLALFLVMLVAYVRQNAHDLFEMGETELVRSVYTENPFLEAPEIGRYLAAHTVPDDRIAVLGSEPEIYFYANRPSATGYIYTYALLEPQPYAARMRSEMRREVEDAQPPYLVVSGIPGSWGPRQGSDLSILEWANAFATTCYDMVGIAEVEPRQGAVLHWDADAATFKPRSPSVITVFRHKPGPPCRAPGLP